MSSYNNNISVAMATYNGEKYLREQIDSILLQSYKVDEIIVSDDNSIDNTVEILKEYQNKGVLKYFINPKKGIVENFKNAVINCKKDNFIALSDQDDIWLPEKNELCINELKKINPLIPALVFSDLKVIDANGNEINQSFFNEVVEVNPEFEKLQSELYSNKVIGCATVFNPAMRKYFEQMPNNIFMHDYWIALISFTFGKHIYIKKPLVNYRRHANNFTSTHDHLIYKIFKELTDYLLNRKIVLDEQIDSVITFNKLYSDKFDSKMQQCIKNFINLRHKPTFVKRLQTFKFKSSKQ